MPQPTHPKHQRGVTRGVPRATARCHPVWVNRLGRFAFLGRCPRLWNLTPLGSRAPFAAVVRRVSPLVVAVLLALTTPAFAQNGTIRGTLDPCGADTTLAVVDRTTGKKHAAQLDAASGQFEIAVLPLGGTFDFLIEGGTSLVEGIDLSVPRSDYEEEQPLTKDDVLSIKQKVASLNQFEDTVEVLIVEGNIQHAAVLVNKLRTRPFYGSKPGEIVWRVELWHFERPDENWVKVQDELFLTLHRERLAQAAYKKKSVTFVPSLGGIRLSSETPIAEVGTIKLPPAESGVRVLSEDKS